MDAETLAALKGSIETWERRAKGDYISAGITNCPLCMIFHPLCRKEDINGAKRCSGCPVMEKTGKPYCKGTPYEYYMNIAYDDTEAKMAAAKLEVEFLKSLVPE